MTRHTKLFSSELSNLTIGTESSGLTSEEHIMMNQEGGFFGLFDDKMGKLALDACRDGSYEVVMYLVKNKKIKDYSVTDDKGYTILHHLVKNYYFIEPYDPNIHNVINIILKNPKVKSFINIQDKVNKNTPLHEAVLTNNHYLCNLLIKAGADPKIENNDKKHVGTDTESSVSVKTVAISCENTDNDKEDEDDIYIKNAMKSIQDDNGSILSMNYNQIPDNQQLNTSEFADALVKKYTGSQVFEQPKQDLRKSVPMSSEPLLTNASQLSATSTNNINSILPPMPTRVSNPSNPSIPSIPSIPSMPITPIVPSVPVNPPVLNPPQVNSNNMDVFMKSTNGIKGGNNSPNTTEFMNEMLKNIKSYQKGGVVTGTRKLISRYVSESQSSASQSHSENMLSSMSENTLNTLNSQSGGYAKKKKSTKKSSKNKKMKRFEQLSELSRMIENQAEETHKRVIERIKEILGVDEVTARAYKAWLYSKVKGEKPELNNYDRAIEMEKMTVREVLEQASSSQIEEIKSHIVQKDKERKERPPKESLSSEEPTAKKEKKETKEKKSKKTETKEKKPKAKKTTKKVSRTKSSKKKGSRKMKRMTASSTDSSEMNSSSSVNSEIFSSDEEMANFSFNDSSASQAY
jgi:adenylate kinase/ribonuclease R